MPQTPRKKRFGELLRKYGISEAQYEALLVKQGGGCAICGASVADPRGYNLHVDHCHRTGVVRGLLCGRCNRGIGLVEQHIDRVVQYLGPEVVSTLGRTACGA